VSRRAKYKAHEEQQQYKAGDVVEFRVHRPLSREKRWTVVRLIERPVET
jgi:small subunit ribosomal protein S17